MHKIKISGKYCSQNISVTCNMLGWKEANSYLSVNWESICYSNGKFIAIGDSNKIIYSTNAINWTQVTVPSAGWESVCYGNGKFVAVGDSGKVMYAFY